MSHGQADEQRAHWMASPRLGIGIETVKYEVINVVLSSNIESYLSILFFLNFHFFFRQRQSYYLVYYIVLIM